MNNIVRMQLSNSIDNLLEYENSLSLRDLNFSVDFSLQLTPIAIFHHYYF